ncbi:MAG: hypothetical protein HYY50_00645 [Candidatus Kerfeldbacteria bacterium]|nr:hypothetical protein [Candidatus Kerfeldbacteria bacterium]
MKATKLILLLSGCVLTAAAIMWLALRIWVAHETRMAHSRDQELARTCRRIMIQETLEFSVRHLTTADSTYVYPPQPHNYWKVGPSEVKSEWMELIGGDSPDGVRPRTHGWLDEKKRILFLNEPGYYEKFIVRVKDPPCY